MKKLILLSVAIILLLTQSAVAAPPPTSCNVNITDALRDQSVQVINELMGAAMRTGDYVPDMALLQKAQSTMAALNSAYGPGCPANQ